MFKKIKIHGIYLPVMPPVIGSVIWPCFGPHNVAYSPETI